MRSTLLLNHAVLWEYGWNIKKDFRHPPDDDQIMCVKQCIKFGKSMSRKKCLYFLISNPYRLLNSFSLRPACRISLWSKPGPVPLTSFERLINIFLTASFTVSKSKGNKSLSVIPPPMIVIADSGFHYNKHS